MKLILYPHGGSGNHGCEAIVRSTKLITDAAMTLFSNHPEEDIRYGLNAVCNIRQASEPISRYSINYLSAFISYHLGNYDAYDEASFRSVFRCACDADYALSIGGDNYCYGIPEYICIINRRLRKLGVKTILWGCSVDPDAMQGKMLDDLKGYSHIFARESITFMAMKAKGIEKVSLFPDPAFQLGRIDLPLPDGFAEYDTVGINFSPMIIGCEKENGLTIQNYINLISYIIDNTDMQIALIPHVVWSHNDDRKPLRVLYERFAETGRVIMIADHNAEELKGYIARCRFMVAARTHASIAAYSSQVPTIVVGYSVKARGIAKDIFGTYQNYVIPVQMMQKPNELSDGFKWLCSHEEEIKAHYRLFMPEYVGRAMEAGEVIKSKSI